MAYDLPPAYRVQLVKEAPGRIHEDVTRIEDAAAIIEAYLEGADREHFVVLMLDSKCRAIGITTACSGTINQSAVWPREVFKPALLANASMVIVGHNHPSGDPEPSTEDIAVTRHLVEVGQALGCEVVDHIVVGDPGQFRSLKRLGYIS